MATRLCAHSAAMSEFAAGYHGDCGQTALLAAMHVLLGTPLDAAQLKALVVADIAAHRAEASGAERLSSITAVLQARGMVAGIQQYREPFEYDWLTLLRNDAGTLPIILQLANGQALPGDEKGLEYHFICVLGIQPAGYLCADGDNPACRSGALVNYDRVQLANAQPCGLIVCQAPPAPAAPPPAAPDPNETGQQLAQANEALAAARGQVANLQQQLAGAQAAFALVAALKGVL